MCDLCCTLWRWGCTFGCCQMLNSMSLIPCTCTYIHMHIFFILHIEYTFVLDASNNELFNFGPAVWLWQFSNGIELMVIRLCTYHAPIMFGHTNTEPSLFGPFQHWWSASKMDQVLTSLVEIYYMYRIWMQNGEHSRYIIEKLCGW